MEQNPLVQTGWLAVGKFNQVPLASGCVYLETGEEIAMSLLYFREKARLFLGDKFRERFRRYQGIRLRWLQFIITRVFLGSNLRALAIFYGTDKWGGHRYADHYMNHFRHRRGKNINLLEIGIGGNEDPELGGASLRMWRTYFPHANIYGIDIVDKRLHEEQRIKTFLGSQEDTAFLERVADQIGPMDIIIDDGSHINHDVLTTFKYLFPRLNSNGIYVIEDVQTSYWKKYGGSSLNLQRTDTTMGYVKQLIDNVNKEDFEETGTDTGCVDMDICEIHFYHNLIFIYKNER
jgi:hypothetical protein